ncbi:MAG TPA: alpha-glucan family phosphorylase, partial [Holophaga sp.]|nr:alpha-glucan family phosphorylase [Holophaga sp.]
EQYHKAHRNPLRVLREVDPAFLEQRAAEVDIQTRTDRALRQLSEYLNPVTTWGLVHAGPLQSRPVAYFCAEFGIHESIPIYSGGLGILAGDHLKGASNLGIPLIAVGLLYRQGYTTQVLDASYWQHDVKEPYEIEDLPIRPALGPGGQPVRISVELPGRMVHADVWEARVGRIRLILLDTKCDANSEEDQGLAAQLYGGDQRMRIQQEMLLGVGGSRALRALGITPSVYHLNEGHSAFAILEWARHRVQADGLDPWLAIRTAAAGTVFTTHTPVEAGHDRFPADLAAEHLQPLADGLKLPVHDVLGLGRIDPADHNAQFLPTVLALKCSRRANAVSALHGVVSRNMWQCLWPDRKEEEIPIGHVTNGVHTATWLSAELNELFQYHLGASWMESIVRPDLWMKLENIDPAEIWEIKQVLKARMMRLVRSRVGAMHARLGLPEENLPNLDPDVLTIGFARRFVPYKR